MNTERTNLYKVALDGTKEPKSRVCLEEHELEIVVNEKTMYHLVCTQDRLKELVYGRLYTDRIIDSAEDVKLFFLCRSEHTATVLLDAQKMPEPILDKELSCCSANHRFCDVEGKRQLHPIGKHEVDWEKVFYLTRVFQDDRGLHGDTAAVHKSILLLTGDNGANETVCFEDIGRHNTVDKAVGFAILNHIDLSTCMVFTSGRVPVDMTEKLIAAGVPVLVSKSVPTADSVRMAKQYGLSLICRAWPDGCELYSPV
ncbi:MAG: formate dehydrogenase accessory sulfurtransferase FdhD [Lachnospiraceae bacterium]|nr:formate dehydrogenase accessory sulfurtransferase FdhD [Lachnospiraceae bacterium]